MSKQKEERASHGWKISQVQIARLDFRGREGTNTEHIPHQNTGLAGAEKSHTAVRQEPHPFPRSCKSSHSLHTFCHCPTPLGRKKPTCSTSWNHVAAGRLQGDSGTLQLSPHYLFWVQITCKVPCKPCKYKADGRTNLAQGWQNLEPCLLPPQTKAGIFSELHPPAQGKRIKKNTTKKTQQDGKEKKNKKIKNK